MQYVQQFLQAHWQVLAVVYGANILGSAVQAVLKKVIDLTPEVETADSVISKAAAYAGKLAEYSHKLIDLVTGNVEHKE